MATVELGLTLFRPGALHVAPSKVHFPVTGGGGGEVEGILPSCHACYRLAETHVEHHLNTRRATRYPDLQLTGSAVLQFSSSPVLQIFGAPDLALPGEGKCSQARGRSKGRDGTLVVAAMVLFWEYQAQYLQYCTRPAGPGPTNVECSVVGASVCGGRARSSFLSVVI